MDPKARNNDVHRPIHEYIGRKGKPAACVKLYSAAVKARVRPVGPKKVMGWPDINAYTIPPIPHEVMNSMTPIEPSVMILVKPGPEKRKNELNITS